MKERIRVSVFVLFTTKVDVVVTCFAASRGMLLPLYANNLLGLESVILGSELFRALVRKIKALPCPVQSQRARRASLFALSRARRASFLTSSEASCASSFALSKVKRNSVFTSSRARRTAQLSEIRLETRRYATKKRPERLSFSSLRVSICAPGQ